VNDRKIKIDRTPSPGASRYRAPNKIGATVALKQLYDKFFKPFMRHFDPKNDWDVLTEGAEAFFGLPYRRIAWCKATEAFKLPGGVWASQSEPHKVYQGAGRRHVRKGDSLVIRRDMKLKKNEVEFDEQVFVLTDAELAFIEEKIAIIA
jgi:hypothetical protein